VIPKLGAGPLIVCQDLDGDAVQESAQGIAGLPGPADGLDWPP